MNNAKDFITKIQTDSSFRISLYEYDKKNDLFDFLKESGYSFTEIELENTLNQMLTRCQYQEIGEQLETIKIWWNMLLM
ncbi:MAG: hypothetical protein A2015_07875 [Spirochaetes bacterium GWF1_31_7]|nr:MAG: hypothetical protein A2Y30_01965 [Spirochaetes bacterium GWE1_32_154]OHD46959.1 MAG: hypothetical protein A2015_07875 [Spirochaetes bacterium GWF1_31_7]OHD49739.1 MAG: hypothetical protein A2Y29_06075 [Spirochaetes bacterium GWE2_31_10]OHD80126.1 MAG: hypothetical protein A2355_04870 [Spirochaetes bacterium RIFOXYB1_FULL_32_8]HBD95533.1 hypothetical protein [Spirochaetia bacterium]